MNKFHDILNKSLDVPGFEAAWKSCLEENNLVNNVWLKEMYAILDSFQYTLFIISLLE